MSLIMLYSPKKYMLIFLFVITFFCSCKNEKPVSLHGDEIFNSKEEYMKANQYLVQKDAEQIKSYVERRGWDMTQTKTGLWYMIYQKGNGANAKDGSIISLSYTATLLDGTQCYNSEESGPKEFMIGKGGVESGLEEGVLLLKEGDKAKFIIPPHLGHGLLGDNNKIPPRAIIVYDVEVLSISEP